jgi:kynurenine formamidase
MASGSRPKTPAYPPRTFKVLVLQPGQAGGNELGPNKTTYNDDIIEGWVGIGSQIDGLGHIGVNWIYYNGLKSGDFVAADGLKKLGVEKIPPIVTRGVLLDMAGYLGTDLVKEGTAFNVAEIEGAAKKQGVEIRQGDVVIFHTGWVSLIGKDDKRYSAGEPGLGVEGAKYLVSKGVVAIGADTWALEVIPFESKNVFEVHQILLPMSGTYILENMNTGHWPRTRPTSSCLSLACPRSPAPCRASSIPWRSADNASRQRGVPVGRRHAAIPLCAHCSPRGMRGHACPYPTVDRSERALA